MLAVTGPQIFYRRAAEIAEIREEGLVLRGSADRVVESARRDSGR